MARQVAHHAPAVVPPGFARHLPRYKCPLLQENIIRKPARAHECGASMLESTVCLLALLLAGFTVFEIAQWHVTRHLTRLALHAATREGALTGANPKSIESAAATVLRSRHAPIRRLPAIDAREIHSIPGQRVRSGLRPLRIEILSPTAPMFADFADAPLSQTRQRPTIRNDFLAEQHAAHRARGWEGGAGPLSRKDIFDANTLRLRLTVLHAPHVPGLAMLIRMMPATGDPVTDTAHRNGLLPIAVEADSAMHSHPMLWVEPSPPRDDAPLASNGRIAGPQAVGAHQDGSRGDARLQGQDEAPDTSLGTRMASGSVAGTSAFANPAYRAELTPIANALPARTKLAADRPNLTPDTAALCGTLLCCPAK